MAPQVVSGQHLHQSRPSSPPSVVIYAVSAGGILFGVSLITTFALLCRWRKSRKERALEIEIDQLIGEKVSRVPVSRSHTAVKLPSSAFSVNKSAYPLPLLSSSRSATASSSDSNAVLPRPSCIRNVDRRIRCGCPDCLILVRSITVAHTFYRPSSRIAPTSARAARRYNPAGPTSPSRAAREPPAASLERPRSGWSTPPTHHLPSAARAHPRANENTPRSAAPGTLVGRAPSPLALEHAWALQQSDHLAPTPRMPPAARARGVVAGMGITLEGSSLDAVHSHARTTHTLLPAAISPRIMDSSPLLSDDAGETTLAGGAEAAVSPCAATRKADSGIALSLSSLELAMVHGRLGPARGREDSGLDASEEVLRSAQGYDSMAAPPREQRCGTSRVGGIRDAFYHEDLDVGRGCGESSTDIRTSKAGQWLSDVDWSGGGD